MPPSDDDQLHSLRAAVDGLTYPSESDEPFTVFDWDEQPYATAREALLVHVDRGRTVEEVPLGRFFDELVDAPEARRYVELRRTLASELTEMYIFRVGSGEIRVDVYILGRLKSGHWAGLQTVSVET